MVLSFRGRALMCTNSDGDNVPGTNCAEYMEGMADGRMAT